MAVRAAVSDLLVVSLHDFRAFRRLASHTEAILSPSAADTFANDPDAAFDRAVTAGANVAVPVGDQYRWRPGRVAHPFGHHWEIGKPLTESKCAARTAKQCPSLRAYIPPS